MTRAEIRDRLAKCAVEMERGIETWMARYDRGELSVACPPEAVVDVNGRPILAQMYADLGTVLVALANLDPPPTDHPRPMPDPGKPSRRMT